MAPTPLPVGKVAVVALVLFANQFSSLVIFPFLPFMVHDFFPHITKDQLGFYSGYLATSFHLGALCAHIIWGKLADRYGRRPILLCGIVGTMVSITLFGFSRNYAWAITTRFMWGLLNGNIGVAKAYLSEVCDDSNTAKGFSVIGFSAGIGRLLGPAAGAFLSNLATQYPDRFGDNEFLKTFPYALPCFFGTLISIVSLTLAFKYLSETRRATTREAISMRKLDESSSDDIDDAEQEQSLQRRSCCLPGRGGAKYQLLGKAQPMFNCLKSVIDPMREFNVRTPVIIYGLASFCAISMSELYPLWALNNAEHNGLGFTSSQIGVVLIIGAIPQILSQIVLFPKLAARFGYRRLLIFCLLAFILSSVSLPNVAYLARPSRPALPPHCDPASNASAPIEPPASTANLTPAVTTTLSTVLSPSSPTASAFTVDNTSLPQGCNWTASLEPDVSAATWAALILVMTWSNCAQVLAFTAIMVLINNSCVSAIRATVNGLGQSAASLGRMCGPAVSGIVFAWSQRHGYAWPLNFHLMFDIVALLALGNVFLVRSLSPSLDRKKQESGAATEQTLPLAASAQGPGSGGGGTGAAEPDDGKQRTIDQQPSDDAEDAEDNQTLLARSLSSPRRERAPSSSTAYEDVSLDQDDDGEWMSIEEIDSGPASTPSTRIAQSRML